MRKTITKKCRKERYLSMTKMQTKVVSTNNEESEIVTENLYSSREDGVNAMGSLVENDTR